MTLLRGAHTRPYDWRCMDSRKAIVLSAMEFELEEIVFKIKLHEGILNSVKTSNNAKRLSKIKLDKLLKDKNRITDLITESMFLDN